MVPILAEFSRNSRLKASTNTLKPNAITTWFWASPRRSSGSLVSGANERRAATAITTAAITKRNRPVSPNRDPL